MSDSSAAGHTRSMARTYALGPARRTLNVAVTALVKAGLGPRSTYLLTTTGRRSGQPRTTPVTLVEGNNGRWLLAPYGTVGWVHNLRARPDATLRRGRRVEHIRDDEVDPSTAGPILRRYVNAVPVTSPYFDAAPDDPDQRFVAEASRHPVFRLAAS